MPLAGSRGRSVGLVAWGWEAASYAHEVILNELAQGLRTTAEGVEWFEGLSEDDQRKALRAPPLPHPCCDAHEVALRDGRPAGICWSG
ncbi:DUF5958 family protein [Streptomyces sp. 5K101]|uniref:DUF5958 family protein n=1 Tax=Streptomyces sp. 5K101 TaxID=3390037 RepID=UPI0039764AF8